MEEALIQHLLASSSVTALVGARVFPARRPQASELPAIVFTRVSGDRHYADEGPVDLVETRIMIECWATTYAAAKHVARAVRARLIDVKETLDGVEFQASFLEAERDLSEGGSGQAEYLYRTTLDFVVWHREATAP